MGDGVDPREIFGHATDVANESRGPDRPVDPTDTSKSGMAETVVAKANRSPIRRATNRALPGPAEKIVHTADVHATKWALDALEVAQPEIYVGLKLAVATKAHWKKIAFIAVLLVLAVGVLVVGAFAGVIGSAASHPTQACPAAPATGDLSPDQQTTAVGILRAAGELNVPRRGWVIAIATALQESGLRSIDYGDQVGEQYGGSRGAFQQLPSWGSLDDRIDPYRSARLFFLGPHEQGAGGLLAVPGWEGMPLWQASQAVQHSAFPSEYSKHEVAATRIVAQLAGGVASTCGLPSDGPVVFLGDSITVRSESRLRQLLTGRNVTVEAQVGRTLAQGVEALAGHDADLSGATLVVGLCTNPTTGDFAALAQQVMGIASKASAVVWVTCTEWAPAVAGYNQVIRSLGTPIAEWAGPSLAPGMLDPDGVHPTVGPGVDAWSQLVVSSLPAGGTVVGGYALPLPRDQMHPPLPAHHDGGLAVDMPAPTGTPIFAIAAGTVRYVGDACGQGLEVTDATGTRWLYCHASARLAPEGSTVSTGQRVALVGSTGESTGPHLHVQITAGVGRCPQPFLNALLAGQVVDPSSLPTQGPCA